MALTSKIENPLRDKIAFELHKQFGDSKIVCREWTDNRLSKPKTDLAILNLEGEPECLIEFKAHSSMKNMDQWSNSSVSDISKNKALYPDAELIFVLFANFIDELPKHKSMTNRFY